MSDTDKPKTRWFLKAELGVLVCILCIWVIMSVTSDIDSTKAAVPRQADTKRPNSAEVSDKAGENPTNFNEPHPVPFAYKEKINDNTTKSEPETFGLVGGICYSTDRPSAIIDDEVMYEGDTIDGATIVKIYKDKVEFRKNGRNWVQKINKDFQ